MPELLEQLAFKVYKDLKEHLDFKEHLVQLVPQAVLDLLDCLEILDQLVPKELKVPLVFLVR